MTKIYLIRHAEAEGNLYRRAHGQYDSAITPQGYRQINALRDRFATVPIDAVYASDLFRTRTTAAAIYVPKNLPLHTTPALREVNVGAWEDLTWGELAEYQHDTLANFNRDMVGWHVEGSETVVDVQARMLGAIRAIAAENEGKTVAVVSHGMALRILLGTLQGLSFSAIGKTGHSDNTAVSLIEAEGGDFRVIYTNDNSHLGELSTFARQSWWKRADGVEGGIYFAPLSFAEEGAFYLACWRAAYERFGHAAAFDPAAQSTAGQALAARSPGSVVAIRKGPTPVGLLQFDDARGGADKVGYIDFFYLTDECRRCGFGIQLVGQAVSFYRPLGRETLRLALPLAEEAPRARFLGYGFTVTQETAQTITLDKYIGYEQRFLW